MSNLEDFAKTVKDRDPRTSKKKVVHPKGFEPSISYSEKTKIWRDSISSTKRK